MAHDKLKIFNDAKQLITEHGLFFIEDIVALLPIAKSTFYEYFPIDSNESNELKALLDEVKTDLKVKMRSKWYKSDAPALQMALMKLISTPEELKKLAMNYTDITTGGEKINQVTLFELPNDNRNN